MSHYKIISESKDIMLLKKNNRFKLQINAKVKVPCDILEIIENNSFFNMLAKISGDMINKCMIEQTENDNKTNIYLVLKELDEDEDEKLYISFTNKIKRIAHNNIIIIGKKNNLTVNQPHCKKIEIDELLINVILDGDKLHIKLKVLYVGEQLPVFSDNIIGYVFKKLFTKMLEKYC
jgi:hypothetical protein